MPEDKRPARRMRVTISSAIANAWLLPILSPILNIRETFGVPLIVTMDYKTFGTFMAAVCMIDGGQKIGALNIQEIDLKKEPYRVTARNGISYKDEHDGE